MSENDLLFRISQITTYVSKWIIKAKVVNKSKLSTFKNNNSFFSIDVTDVHGDSISCKFWGSAADKWFNNIELKKVYIFSKGRVSIANPKYNTVKHKYELTFNEDSEIHEVKDDGEIKIQKKISLVNLRDIKIATKETPFTADLIGIVKHIGTISNLKTKQGNDITKQNIIIVDDTKHSFEIAFWDSNVNLIKDEIKENEIYVFTNISIRNWNDMKNGTFGVTSSIEKIENLNEELKAKCTMISEWYNTNGKYEQFTNMRNILSNDVSQIPDKHYALSDVNDVLAKISGTYTLVGRIKRIYWKSKENEHRFYYPACTKCKKKLLSSGQDNAPDNDYETNANDEESIVYSCMNCDENNVKPFYNYTFNFLFMDFSGSITLRAFSDEGYNLLGKKAEELKSLDEDTLDYLFNYDFLYKEYKVVVRVNQKVYNGIERVNFTAMRIFPQKHSDISYLLNEIQLLISKDNTANKNKRALNDDSHDAKKQKV
ncbi:replication factor A-related protein [Plasmodium cynomolgi strain B]|uniref:Replication factor A-related protein n=1 Tax=Plasmodium cynomolgi (strain B) TaxID=1120755 RepID=K6URB9_PLACD|nr:replication factor A-related protein [Plasmodium cynomolgi strain B]GAB65624.1 replication factor A-related protein [Plasmodium cynomolgi strain B]